MRQCVSEYRVSSVQNALSVAVFGVLLTAQLSAMLLYLHPRSVWLWFLSVKMNRIGDPVLRFYDQYVPVGPLLSCALLALLCVMPLLAQRRRSWFGAFLSGHLALLVCVSSAVDQLEQASVHYAHPSLDSIIGAATLNWSTVTAITATALLLMTCLLNQFLHWKIPALGMHEKSQANDHHLAPACICRYSTLVCHLRRWTSQAASFHAAKPV